MKQTNLENIQLKKFVFHLQYTLQDRSGFEHNKHLKDMTLVNSASRLLAYFWPKLLSIGYVLLHSSLSSQPIRWWQEETNHDLVSRIFPRLVPVTRICRVLIGSLCCGPFF